MQPSTYQSITHSSKEVVADQDIDPEGLTTVQGSELFARCTGRALSWLQKQDEIPFTIIAFIFLNANIVLYSQTKSFLPEPIGHIFTVSGALVLYGIILLSLDLRHSIQDGRRMMDSEERVGLLNTRTNISPHAPDLYVLCSVVLFLIGVVLVLVIALGRQLAGQ